MPATYRIDKTLRVVVSTWEGVVTFQDASEHDHALRADPDFTPDMLQFHDARTAVAAVDAAGVRRLAKTSPFGPESRRAILVADEVTFGVSRMYEAQVDEAGRVGVFRDLTEACGWLGLPREAYLGEH